MVHTTDVADEDRPIEYKVEARDGEMFIVEDRSKVSHGAGKNEGGMTQSDTDHDRVGLGQIK